MKSAQTAKIGKKFKIARELLGLSEIQVSSKTFINIDYIKAIESGDYDIFPARMFALRYFEKYSIFLGINQLFFDIYHSDNIPKDSQDIKKDQIKDFYPQIKITTMIVFFIVFTFISIYQLSQSNSSEDKINLPDVIIEETLSLASENDQKIIDDAMYLISSVAKPLSNDTEDSTFSEFEIFHGIIHNLSLSFIEESWVEIYQGSDRLIYKLFKTNENLDISITPPFKIIAGNARGIVGFYNQNEINFTQVANKLNVSSIEIDNE